LEKPKILITREQIAQRISELAAQIREDYRDRNPLLICVLKGSFVFMSDLIRALGIPMEIDFIKVTSYGSGTTTSGKVAGFHGLKAWLGDRDILIVEDIVDTGLSMRFLIDLLRRRKPASLKVCALLDKPSRRKTPIYIDYLGFTVPDKFIVGYGLDFDEQFRYLPDVCYLAEDK